MDESLSSSAFGCFLPFFCCRLLLQAGLGGPVPVGCDSNPTELALNAIPVASCCFWHSAEHQKHVLRLHPGGLHVWLDVMILREDKDQALRKRTRRVDS